MAIETVKSYKCDYCRGTIHDKSRYLDAMVYGATFHVECFAKMSAADLLVLLGLDDITLQNVGDEERGDKAAYSKYVLAMRSPAG